MYVRQINNYCAKNILKINKKDIKKKNVEHENIFVRIEIYVFKSQWFHLNLYTFCFMITCYLSKECFNIFFYIFL